MSTKFIISLPCVPGKFQNSVGQTECSDCLSGFYSNTVELIECVACENGKRTVKLGSAACESCNAGRYGISCYSCAIGQYRSGGDSDASVCDVCPLGYYQGATGQGNCISCGSGTYSDVTGVGICKDCQIGKFRNNSDPIATSCRNCSTGFYSDDEGQGTCLPCSPGEFNDVSGATECKDCDENTYYSDKGRQSVCISCQVGMSSEKGSTKCQPCEAGMYSEVVGTCVHCDAGTYRTSKTNATECLSCNKGEYQSDRGQTSCLPCIPGEYANTVKSTGCKKCAMNTYSDKRQSKTTCRKCASGRTSEEGSIVCSSCTAGQYVDKTFSCIKCPAGYISKKATNSKYCVLCGTKEKGESSQAGDSTCSSCDLGKYQTAPGTCENCPSGQYASDKGLKFCTHCDVDTYTSELGKSSKADCNDCSDDRTTGIVNGSTSALACLCKRDKFYTNSNGSCVTCPKGADCSHHDGITLVELVAVPGFWRPTFTSKVFSDCRDGYAGSSRDELAKSRCCPLGNCLGNISLIDNGGNGTRFNHPDEQCKNGYSGPLCIVCAENYVMRSGTCDECVGGSIFTNALYGIVSFAGLVSLFILVILLCAPSKKAEEDQQKYFGQGKIILASLQILASIPGVYDNVPWPNAFIDFTFSINFVNLDFLSFISVSSCSFAVPFLQQMLLHMLLPLFLFIGAVISYNCFKCCVKSINKRKRGNELMAQMMIVGILFLYPSLATKVFSTFRCKAVVGVPGQLLVADRSVKCYSTKHLLYYFIAVGALFLYILGKY